MYLSSQIEIFSDDELSKRVIRFWLDGRTRTLALDYYTECSRPTKRHGFKVNKTWSRLDRTKRNIEKPVITVDETRQIFQRFIDSIRVEDCG